MTYATILVSLGLDGSNKNLLRATVDVARRFDAGVIAIAVAQPLPIYDGGGSVSAK